MLKPIVPPVKLRLVYSGAPSARVLPGPGVAAARVVTGRGVEHRNGAGHLDPAYEAKLRARVHDRVRSPIERAFFSRTSTGDASAKESGEEFLILVTSGADGGESIDEDRSDERGGPFVETSANVEFAYDTDESNPTDGTREPFPTS